MSYPYGTKGEHKARTKDGLSMAASQQDLIVGVTVSNDDAMAETFRDDPAYAVEYLKSILEDGEEGELRIAIRQMTKAFGGVQDVAEKANLNPMQLAEVLTQQGNSELTTLAAILKAMGLRLTVEPIKAA